MSIKAIPHLVEGFLPCLKEKTFYLGVKRAIAIVIEKVGILDYVVSDLLGDFKVAGIRKRAYVELRKSMLTASEKVARPPEL